MNGCRKCPAFDKCTVYEYRGSQCAALRSTYGIESDPEIITMVELKPCPFCGGKDSGMLTTSYDGYWFAVFCENCMVQTRKCRQEKEAIEAWNRRAGEEDKHD